jgi:hypothetical protein
MERDISRRIGASGRVSICCSSCTYALAPRLRAREPLLIYCISIHSVNISRVHTHTKRGAKKFEEENTGHPRLRTRLFYTQAPNSRGISVAALSSVFVRLAGGRGQQLLDPSQVVSFSSEPSAPLFSVICYDSSCLILYPPQSSYIICNYIPVYFLLINKKVR